MDAATRLDSDVAEQWCLYFSPAALRLWSDRIPANQPTRTAVRGFGGWVGVLQLYKPGCDHSLSSLRRSVL